MYNQILHDISRQFGTPCYVYFLDQVLERISDIRQLFQGSAGISYAVKANPNRAILRGLIDQVDYLDVSSAGELLVAIEAGYDPNDCTFVGPAKADWELELALEKSCRKIVVESISEMHHLNEIASTMRCSVDVILRINPASLPKGYGVSMAMRATQFGIDEENLDSAIEHLLELPQLRFYGFHVYAGTQCLNGDSIVQNFTNCARIFQNAAERYRLRPKLLIFGSGFGIPYHDQDRALDMGDIAGQSVPVFKDLQQNPLMEETSIHLELGRYIIGEAGYYLAAVINIKNTRGTQIAVLDGGMNHHLAASGNLGGVIKRNFPIKRLFSQTEGGKMVKYDLTGNLCTNVDSLGRSVELGILEPGEVVVISSSGAYGLTASPLHFITHRPPKEILVEINREKTIITDITRDGTVATPPDWPEVKHSN